MKGLPPTGGAAAAQRSHPSGEPIRVATVYHDHHYGAFCPDEMSTVRWLRISEALARTGFQVDLIIDADRLPPIDVPNLRFVPLDEADWGGYDVVKTLFHRGFDLLEARGGADHPFIISKLGSVVGPTDDTSGVFFSGAVRERLYRTQHRVAEQSRYVAVLTERSRDLWSSCHGGTESVILVPTGVDAVLPSLQQNPYAGIEAPIALYAGTIYQNAQRPVNRYWQHRLNELGRCLRERGIRLCLIGKGLIDRLDATAVTYLGAVSHERIWAYHDFAGAGVVLAQGPVQDNESSKLYNYLRSGLPVVSETPVPNNYLIRDTGLGLVADFEDASMMAEMVSEAMTREWDRGTAVQHMRDHHTWDSRAAIYTDLIMREFGGGKAAP